MNSRTWEGRKVFLGVMGMINSSNKVRTRHRAVAQREQGACWVMKKSSKL